MPLVAVISIVVALIFGVMSLLLPLGGKLITIPVLIVAVAVAGVAFFYGEELQWIDVMWRGLIVEDGCITSELENEE